MAHAKYNPLGNHGEREGRGERKKRHLSFSRSHLFVLFVSLSICLCTRVPSSFFFSSFPFPTGRHHSSVSQALSWLRRSR